MLPAFQVGKAFIPVAGELDAVPRRGGLGPGELAGVPFDEGFSFRRDVAVLVEAGLSLADLGVSERAFHVHKRSISLGNGNETSACWRMESTAFNALCSRHACQDLRLIAYGLLALNGEDLRRMRLHERRNRLADLLSGNDALWFSSNVEGAKGAALFRLQVRAVLGWRKIKEPEPHRAQTIGRI